MNSLQDYMDEYQNQIQKGSIQRAYRGLMDYMGHLRTHIKKTYPDYHVPSNLYVGYMDMTFFTLVPKSLNERGLKITIVFLHEDFRFEAWLSGKNKQILIEYWVLMKDHDWKSYRVASHRKGETAILEHTLVEKPNFSDLDGLTEQIEIQTLRFVSEIEDFLVKQRI